MSQIKRKSVTRKSVKPKPKNQPNVNPKISQT